MPLQLPIPPQGHRVESGGRFGGGLAAERQGVCGQTIMSEIIERLRQVPGSRLRPLAQGQISAIRAKYPHVPDDYLLLLSQLGHGRLGDSQFSVYSGLVPAASILGPVEGRLESILFVGDDFAGGHVGYDTSMVPWRLVSFDHSDLEGIIEKTSTLLEYLGSWVLDAA
jgi:hypothetical protein